MTDDDNWCTDAWCPICGHQMPCITDNFYYCPKCDKNFKFIEIEESQKAGNHTFFKGDEK